MLEILDTVVLQEFVSHPVMERLNEPVMPGLAWWDECLDCLTLGCPLLERMSDELGPVIHPDRPPCSRQATSRSSVTETALMFLSTVKARCSRVYSSIMLQILIVLPCQVESNWKSNAHTLFGYWPAGTSRWVSAARRLSFFLGKTRKPSSRQILRKVSRHIPYPSARAFLQARRCPHRR